MVGITQDSKSGQGDIDGGDSKISGPSPRESRLGEWATSRRELWCFYLYYVGNNGLSGFNLGPSQFQNLLYLAGYDPSYPPFTEPCGNETSCALSYLGYARDVNSIILLTNGISFAIQAILLLVIGAWADYGTWRPNILIVFTILSVGVSFAWLGVQHPSQWPVAIVLYILGLTSYQCCLTFWGAAFPGLVRNLPEVQASANETEHGSKSFDEHSRFESLERNRVSNISFVVSSAGEVFFLGIMIGILRAVKSDASVENNTVAFSVLLAFSGGVWLLCAIPWFIFEKRRPGLELPLGAPLFTIGFKQTFVTFRECLRLKQTLLYLVFYFLMGDVLNTTVTTVATLQNSVVSYSTLQLTLMLLVGIIAQGLGTYLLWVVQKRYGISTKRMLLFIVFWILVLTVWGLVGVHTTKIGFKHVWEVWLYQVLYGFFVCPWYAFSQTMICEVSPLPQMFLFFSLFSVIGKTSAVIGPFVSEAIISASGNNDNMPFTFLFGLGMFSTVFLFMLDVEKSRIECEEFVIAEARHGVFSENKEK